MLLGGLGGDACRSVARQKAAAVLVARAPGAFLRVSLSCCADLGSKTVRVLGWACLPFFLFCCSHALLGGAGLGWAGLGWAGLGWGELGQVGLVVLGWAGLG